MMKLQIPVGHDFFELELPVLTREQGEALRRAGYFPEIRWRRVTGEGTSILCTTGEALMNIEIANKKKEKK